MASKFPFVKSPAIELAVQLWADWLDSVERARTQLGWRDSLSEEERACWLGTLDRELVWGMAMSNLDRLRLPRLWASYWIACVLSPYRPDDPTTYWRIRCPSWAASRTNALVSLESEEIPKGYNKRVIMTTGGGSFKGEVEDERSLPPLGLEVVVPDSPSSVSLRLPVFLIPGLIQDPSPLLEVLREAISEHRHPLSDLLQRVGRPVGGDWARKMVSEANPDQLRLLYKYLFQSEYGYELVESLSQKELKKVVASSGNMKGDPLVLGYYAEQLVGKKERLKIRCRVRKRVTGWFKTVGRWPLPKE